nr:peptidase dimerization domain-containing protein [uncultured Oscillibacter sp.]
MDITGKGGHGSRPDLVPNALAMACDIYQHLVSIPSNRFEASRACVVAPCALQAGQSWNILPESAWLEGTIRFSNPEDGETLMNLIRSTAGGIAGIHGGAARVESSFAAYPIINDPGAAALGQAASSACGLTLLHTPPAAISDNFSEFLRAFPGFFCFVGCRSARKGGSSVHHAPNFDFDEAALAHISRFFSACVEQFLLKP